MSRSTIWFVASVLLYFAMFVEIATWLVVPHVPWAMVLKMLATLWCCIHATKRHRYWLRREYVKHILSAGTLDA